jgi:predicted DNA-binding transcriptional regulator AlpA
MTRGKYAPTLRKLKEALKKEAKIVQAVNERISTDGILYTDEVMETSGCSRESITNWLKKNGFEKPGGIKSRRWVKV